MQRLLDNNNIYTLLRRVFLSGGKDFLLNLICATSGMQNIQKMAGSRGRHPERWPCMACLLSTPCSTTVDILPMAVPRLGHICLSLSPELHGDRATRCCSWLWHPCICLCGTNDCEVLAKDKGYSSGQPERLNKRHESEVQSLEISFMAKEKNTVR